MEGANARIEIHGTSILSLYSWSYVLLGAAELLVPLGISRRAAILSGLHRGDELQLPCVDRIEQVHFDMNPSQAFEQYQRECERERERDRGVSPGGRVPWLPPKAPTKHLGGGPYGPGGLVRSLDPAEEEETGRSLSNLPIQGIYTTIYYIIYYSIL